MTAGPERDHPVGPRLGAPGPSLRLVVAARYLAMTLVLVGAVGLAGHWLAWPLLTSTVGPTAYLFAAHPESEYSRLRNALIGHTVGLGAGFGALVAFGLLHQASVSTTGAPTWAQTAAAALSVGATVAVLEVLGTHHAPAAATALLVATGLAKPGAPLVGLVMGLAIVIAVGPLLGRLPGGRRATEVNQRALARADLHRRAGAS